ncbi:MAG TPA: hypothetical protein VJ124_10135 [Pyrinomonadaceae bacterium]|nr:hypothetical protein [Pyrinomonadaceae bacterium]
MKCDFFGSGLALFGTVPLTVPLRAEILGTFWSGMFLPVFIADGITD